MKKLLYISIIIALFTACKSKPQKSVADSTAAISTTPVDSAAIIIKQFQPYITGDWVIKAYVDEIRRTRSPLVASQKLGEVSSMAILLSDTIKKKVRVSVNWGNHEGSSFNLYLQHGHASNFLKTDWVDRENKEDYYELGYMASNADTTLMLYHYNKSHQLLDHETYVRVMQPNADGETRGVDYIVNKLLFAGNYTYTDSLSHSYEVSFGIDGKVSGLDGLKTYQPLNDFSVGPDNTIDQIYFNQPKKLIDYTYKLIADTLSLYTSITSETDGTVTSGPLKYKLVKKH